MFPKFSLRNAIVALSLLASACGAGPELSGATQDLKTSTSTVTSSFALHTTSAYTTGTPSWQSTFTIASTYNVYFGFDIPSSKTGSHSMTVYIYAPDGSLYQKNVVAFAAGTTAASGQQQALKTSTGFRVWTSLPVAGTFIDQYGMTGAWKAQAMLDSASTPNASVTFNLQ